MKYILVQLLQDSMGKIIVEVRYKNFPIIKILDPQNPDHATDIATAQSGNKGEINNLVERMGNELVSGLKKTGILDLDGNPTNPAHKSLI